MNNRLVAAAFKSATAYIILMTAVTIAADLYKPLKSFLAGITGHHWTAKGLLGIIFFIVLTAVLNATSKDEDVSKSISMAIGSTIFGMAALLAFYVVHYFA